MDGRGKYMIEVRVKNQARVKNFMKKHPELNMTEVAKKLNMSVMTLRRHRQAIKLRDGCEGDV